MKNYIFMTLAIFSGKMIFRYRKVILLMSCSMFFGLKEISQNPKLLKQKLIFLKSNYSHQRVEKYFCKNIYGKNFLILGKSPNPSFCSKWRN